LLAFLLSHTIRNGWRRTLPAAFAPLISDIPIVLLVILVLTRTPEWSLHLLRIIGGFFLIYMAYGAFKNFESPITTAPQPSQSTYRGMLNAALMNLLNPNPYIFWATIAGPIFIAGWRKAPGNGISFVIGFYLMLIGGFMSFVALFALTKRLNTRTRRLINGISALALLFFGLYQLWLGMRQW
jgi:threonine/homoserine/homoserine lactone efflux protein